MASNDDLQRAINKWASRLVPLILVGLVGYASWVVIDPLAVDYLLRPQQGIPARSGATVAIIVLHSFFLLPMALTYFRVLQVVAKNPGLVPKPSRLNGLRRGDELGSQQASSSGYLDRPAVLEGRIPPPAGLDQFLAKDVYECDVDGLPRWCSVCESWKPDRSHHSSEMGRCVFKMDHYCPWAGGIISETNFKFFIQFCIYAAFYCAFVLVSCSYFTWEYRNKYAKLNYNWIALIVISGLFFLFSFGMAVNSMYFAAINTTTVDNLTRQTRIHHVAVSISHPEFSNQLRVSESHQSAPGGSMISTNAPNSNSQNAITPTYTVIRHPSRGRTYAILQTPTGGNLYRLNSAVANMKTVMGDAWYDWFLPIKMSPCCSHHQLSRTNTSGSSGVVSMYKLGPLIDTMRIQAGLDSSRPKSHGSRRRRKKRRRRRPRNGTQGGSENGEYRQESELQQLHSTSERTNY